MGKLKTALTKLVESLRKLSKHPWRLALTVLAIPCVVILIFLLYKFVDNITNDIKFKTGERDRVAELRENYKASEIKWNSSNIKGYQFTLQVSLGGEVNWEEFGTVTSGPISKHTYKINVADNEITSIEESTSLETVTLDNTAHFYTVPDLFELIGNLLDLTENPDTLQVESEPDQMIFIPAKSEKEQLKYHAEFESVYGYPTLIYLYFQHGNYERFDRTYFITYIISDFEKLN